MRSPCITGAAAAAEQCIDVILCKELKQSYCEILESVPAVFAKLSRNFHPSLSGCSALAGNRLYITGLSIYYRDMPCFDGLYLKKSRSPCSVLEQNNDIFNWAEQNFLKLEIFNPILKFTYLTASSRLTSCRFGVLAKAK